jgi:hypothetical protein
VLSALLPIIYVREHAPAGLVMIRKNANKCRTSMIRTVAAGPSEWFSRSVGAIEATVLERLPDRKLSHSLSSRLRQGSGSDEYACAAEFRLCTAVASRLSVAWPGPKRTPTTFFIGFLIDPTPRRRHHVQEIHHKTACGLGQAPQNMVKGAGPMPI